MAAGGPLHLKPVKDGVSTAPLEPSPYAMMNPFRAIAAASVLLPFVCSHAVIPDPLPKAPEPVEDILRLQIFLDTHLFGPGKVDGRPGEFTTKALKRYQRAHGLPETEMGAHTLDLSGVEELYTTSPIRPGDLLCVGALPRQPSAQSKKKYLPYDSLLEFLTERFHCSPEFLEHINQPMKLGTLKPGDVVKVPNVQPFLIEELKPIPSLPEIPEHQTRVIKIDTREKMLDLIEGDKLLASAELRRAHRERLPAPHRSEQSRGRDVDRLEQGGHRHSWHKLAPDHRPQLQPRLHEDGQLGCGPARAEDHQRHDGDHRGAEA